jgi:hypothetical protein
MPRRKQPLIPDELLDQLLAGSDPRAALADGGLLDGLKKALAERALNAEMDHHLDGGEPDGRGNSRNGYGGKTVLTGTGKLELQVPRDRLATFDRRAAQLPSPPHPPQPACPRRTPSPASPPSCDHRARYPRSGIGGTRLPARVVRFGARADRTREQETAYLTSRGRRFRHHHAAAHADRGENHDPTGTPITAQASPLRR